jgi:hypothetical protein
MAIAQSSRKNTTVIINHFKLLLVINNSSFSESGSQRQVGPKPKDIGNVNRGSYSDSILDNTAVNWVADDNGIQVTSDHLPDSTPTDGGVGKMLADLKK